MERLMRETSCSDHQTDVRATKVVLELAFVPSVRLKTSGSAGSLLCLLLMLILLAFQASGQELAGTFIGTVTDTSGAVIPHATVTIKLNGVSGASRVVQTNDSGNYTATNLPAGTYTITVSDQSFEKGSERNVLLN